MTFPKVLRESELEKLEELQPQKQKITQKTQIPVSIKLLRELTKHLSPFPTEMAPNWKNRS